MIGKQFGRLSVIAALDERVNTRRYWLCRCQCGQLKRVREDHLCTGAISSCGCLRLEAVSAAAKHGQTYTPTWTTWKAMLQRCREKSWHAYHRYGGRGIVVCARWLGPDGFTNFLADMGERPAGMTLDRVDPDGNYEPANCRWATATQQARNRGRSAS